MSGVENGGRGGGNSTTDSDLPLFIKELQKVIAALSALSFLPDCRIETREGGGERKFLSNSAPGLRQSKGEGEEEEEKGGIGGMIEEAAKARVPHRKT